MQCIHQWRLLLDVKKVQIAGYSRITVCITVFGVFSTWGRNGLDLQPLVKIKTVRPAIKLRLAQNSKKQRNLNKKRTVWCVLILVPVVGLEPTTY